MPSSPSSHINLNPHVSTSPPKPSQDSAKETSPKASSPPAQSEPAIAPAEAKKIAQLESKIEALEDQIAETEAKQRKINSQLKTDDPQALVDKHIKLLHEYNEIRDMGQGLMGIIAEQRGVRVVDVYEEFGAGPND